jgi:regulator of PEP synthase PpsR (kinase-PPPase family)
VSSENQGSHAAPPPIYLVSGGVGASGEQLVHTVLAQFPDYQVPVITFGNVRRVEQLEKIVAQAKTAGGLVVHTFVDGQLRQTLATLAQDQEVTAIDLMGELLSRLANLLGCEPAGKPGLYRQLRRDYFDRVSAIEFTMAHDDGKNAPGWSQADIILTGVSRTGKTPLSIYLSVLGWKVANVPLILELPTPPELLQLDPHRVIGLTIDPDQLLMLREQRFRRMGSLRPTNYIDPEKIREEVQAADRFFRQHRFTVIDVSDKPIESSADEIIRIISGQPSPT